MRRRLAAILAADVVGYSRLIGLDEEGTLSSMRSIRDEIFEPLLKAYEGRIANTAGDSFLIEFPSAVQAVRFSMELQSKVKVHQAKTPSDRRILYRVGINIGDVMADDDDLLGDGVNVAARLEANAPEGGIVVSRSVRDQIQDRLSVGLTDLGELQLKNIARPIRAFEISPNLNAGPASTNEPQTSGLKLRKLAVAGIGLGLILAAGWASYAYLIARDDSDQLPTVAVFPFDTLGPVEGETWLAEGLAVEVINELSLADSLKVLGRTATFGISEDLRTPSNVLEQTNAAFMLEGEARLTESDFNLNVRLIDTDDGATVWTERYSTPATPADLISVQASIATRIATAIGDDTVGAAFRTDRAKLSAQSPALLPTYLCHLESLSLWMNPDQLKKVYECALEATENEPESTKGWQTLANVMRRDIVFGYGVTGMPAAEAVPIILAALQKAKSIDPNDSRTLVEFAMAMRLVGQRQKFWDAAEDFLSKGWRLNTQTGWLGMALAHSGKWERGIEVVETAMANSPGAYPSGWHWAKADFLYLNGDYEEALAEYHKAATPNHFATEVHYAHVYAALGRMDDAKAAVDRLLADYPHFSVKVVSGILKRLLFDPALIPKIETDLKLAGLPVE